MPGYIHHVEWCVTDLKRQVTSLVEHYGFVPIGQRLSKDFQVQQVAVKSGATVFILTQKLADDAKVKHQDLSTYPFLTCCQDEHLCDSVFNVCLKVGPNLPSILAKVQAEDIVLNRPDELAVIKSCCGNIIHTLLKEDLDLCKIFADPIQDFTLRIWNDNQLKTTHMDHVTYVCEPGDSKKILQWYADLFNMKRFLVNPKESIEEGVAIGEEVNMRLTVGEWIASWLCREEGVELEDSLNQE